MAVMKYPIWQTATTNGRQRAWVLDIPEAVSLAAKSQNLPNCLTKYMMLFMKHVM